MKSPRWPHGIIGLVVGIGSLLAAAPSHAQDAPAIAATPDEQAMAEARRQFQAGVNLLDDPDGARYEEAYLAFHKAFALSKSPKVLGNIGFCSLKLERDGEAIDAYTAYLRESRDIDPRERAQIERDLATLGSTVGALRVTVRKPPGAFIVVDTRQQSRGAPVVNAYPFQGTDITLRLRPGRHSLKVKTSDAESIPYDITIESGAQASHEFTFPTPVKATTPTTETTKPSPSYAGPVVLGILGVAALGTGAATGFLARSKTDDIDASCPNGVCPASFDLASARSEAKTFGTIADATFIGGGVALGGALIWAIALPSKPKSPPRTGTSTFRPAAACDARGCGVQLGGAF